MRVQFLVEGRSEAAFFESWARRLLRGHEVRTHPHQGKGRLPKPGQPVDHRRRGLLDQLPAKLRGWGKAAPDDRIVVVVDADEENCVWLRRELDAMLATIEPRPTVLFRIAIEELEAFYLGDQHALKASYPDLDVAALRAYEPDSIVGTAELFGRIIHDGGLNKVEWAERLGPKLTTRAAASRSPSFRKLVDGLLRLAESGREAARPGRTNRARRISKVARKGPRRRAE